MTASEKFARASSEMARLEARLGEVRAERVAAIEEMRGEGLSWADIEKATGLTRQRLWKITKHGVTLKEAAEDMAREWPVA